jgi:hypothetical protein
MRSVIDSLKIEVIDAPIDVCSEQERFEHYGILFKPIYSHKHGYWSGFGAQ